MTDDGYREEHVGYGVEETSLTNRNSDPVIVSDCPLDPIDRIPQPRLKRETKKKNVIRECVYFVRESENSLLVSLHDRCIRIFCMDLLIFEWKTFVKFLLNYRPGLLNWFRYWLRRVFKNLSRPFSTFFPLVRYTIYPCHFVARYRGFRPRFTSHFVAKRDASRDAIQFETTLLWSVTNAGCEKFADWMELYLCNRFSDFRLVSKNRGCKHRPEKSYRSKQILMLELRERRKFVWCSESIDDHRRNIDLKILGRFNRRKNSCLKFSITSDLSVASRAAKIGYKCLNSRNR